MSHEVFIWDTEPGWLVLDGGERIWVERGDKLTGVETNTGVRFIERLRGSA